MKKINLLILVLTVTMILAACDSNHVKDSAASIVENSNSIQDIDVSMPEPFNNSDSTGGDQLRRYYDPYVIKYGNFPGSLLDLVDQDELTDWVNEFEDGTRDKNEANIHTFLKEFNINKETALEWLESDNKLAIENGITPLLTLEDIEILYSDNQELIDQNFVSDYSIYFNKKIYTPEWIYTHTTDDYKKERIPSSLISKKLSFYKKLPLTSNALSALEKKINSYSKLGLTFDEAPTDTIITEKELVTTTEKVTTTPTMKEPELTTAADTQTSETTTESESAATTTTSETSITTP